METKITTKNYEILIRYHRDGTIGAHKQDIKIIEEDGNVIAENLLAPQELNISDLKSIVASL